MPVGRTEECARIERLLDAARRGRSGAVVFVGEEMGPREGVELATA